jgi:hypothetical protein
MSEKITLTKEGIKTMQTITSLIFVSDRKEEVVVPYTNQPIVWRNISIVVTRNNENGEITSVELTYHSPKKTKSMRNAKH